MSSFTAPSLLLQQQRAHVLSQQTLIVDPLVAEPFEAALWPNTDFLYFRDITPSPGFTTFTWPQLPNKSYSSIVIYFPKSKEKLNWLIDRIAPLTTKDTIIYLVGDNKGGIKSCAKLVDEQLLHLRKIASGKHCLLFQALFNQLYSANNDIQFSQQIFNLDNNSIEVASLPSVFSHGRLDKGTELLLNSLPQNISGSVLDFACGCGVIGSYIGKHYKHSQLTLSDMDALAVESSKKSLKLNHIQADCILSDGLTKISSKFDWIFTNPPFHTGVKIDYHVVENFIKHCHQSLKKQGQLILVANSFLKYQAILEKEFNSTQIIAENSKFKVYQCC